MFSIWWEYAFTSLDRGKVAVQLMQKYRPIRGARYLDVGTAYGGFPIAFAQGGASEAVGIEQDPALFTLAQEQLKDCPCTAQILLGDAMDGAFMRSLGSFDIITCNDVIEHVDDAWKLVRHLAECLRPGGVISLEIPNSRSIGQVVKDGHYGLFGVSLLCRPEAIAYYEQKFTEPYAVGEYYSLDQYVAALDMERINLQCIDAVNTDQQAVDRLRAKFEELDVRYRTRVEEVGVDETTRRRLLAALTAYAAEFKDEHARLASARDTRDWQGMARRLMLRYETEFWHLVGTKGR
jgi:SAM-dependent methyltransferase